MAKEYFHITRRFVYPWSPYEIIQAGSVIETGDVNPFFNYFLMQERGKIPVNYGDQVHELTEMMFLNEIAKGHIRTTKTVSDVAALGQGLAMHFCKYLRELIWEDIRLNRYPEKPSRKKCLWLAEGADNVDYWREKLGKESDLLVF